MFLCVITQEFFNTTAEGCSYKEINKIMPKEIAVYASSPIVSELIDDVQILKPDEVIPDNVMAPRMSTGLRMHTMKPYWFELALRSTVFFSTLFVSAHKSTISIQCLQNKHTHLPCITALNCSKFTVASLFGSFAFGPKRRSISISIASSVLPVPFIA